MSGITIATQSSDFEASVRSAFGGKLNGDLRRWFSQEGLEDPVAAVEEIAAADPEVVALGPGLPLPVTLDMARELERLRPEITVLIVTPPSAEVWENALRAGARDVIAPDAVAEQLLETFDRALQTGTRLRANLVGTETAAAPQSRLITVLSPKGGSGKTVVASNLAVGLAKRHPGQVVLVDLDILFGDAANALMLVPDQTLADVARSLHTLDATTVKMFLTPHASDLYVMCAPETPSEGELVSGEQVGRVLDLLAQEFSYVVVDTAAGIDEHTLAALDHSTDLLLVADMDVSAVRGLRKGLDLLDKLSITGPGRHLVLNRADSRVGLDRDDIVATLGLDISVSVPSSREVPLSYNRGAPLLETEARSSVAKGLEDIVDIFSPPTARPKFPWRKTR